ncbi:hypothetical protein EJ06DRAFT_556880 [Trichodelitschia bisporula]|uniref:EthD domain-containing protein n=1 Tax=Trichodelitschia bisporula TaxID=703511 RepID=A0A6G1HUL9_9PEZI|nr:hypothetical protein EJ06DRAFT_556880 [Trichodelitschia bisporula]
MHISKALLPLALAGAVLGYTVPASTPLYRVSIYYKRLPNLTEEAFLDHWHKIHGPLCAPWLVKYGVADYQQFHTPSLQRAEFAADSNRTFSAPVPFDGEAAFLVADWRRFMSGFNDPYYMDVIRPDEEKFADEKDALGIGQSALVMALVTRPNYIVKDGKIVVPVSAEVEEKWAQYN